MTMVSATLMGAASACAMAGNMHTAWAANGVSGHSVHAVDAIRAGAPTAGYSQDGVTKYGKKTKKKGGRLTYKKSKKSWTRMYKTLDDQFFTTAEARRIGDNLLLYQHTTGGWPKNVYFPDSLSGDELKVVVALKDDTDNSTIDNKATTTEIEYLARLFGATGDVKYRDAMMRGLEYLFEAQYDNGGWPQFYPRSKGYYTHITYNDDAMVNVLKLMRDVSKGKKPYAFINAEVRAKAKAALDKGVDCIVKTQVRQNGKLTVWCAQHDEHTLQPVKARAFELASLSGLESDDIVLFLMSLSEPSPEVKKAIEAAVQWFRDSKIEGYTIETFTNADGKKDIRLAPCPQDDFPCHPLWARFYTLDTNRPFVCDRDGVMKYSLQDIGYERRNGYQWYNNAGEKVLKKYEEWKKRY